MLPSPSFGQADLTNCERELIHLAGNIQPHGRLMVLDGSNAKIVRASENLAEWMGCSVARLLEQPLHEFSPVLAALVRAQDAMLDEHMVEYSRFAGDGTLPPVEVALHRGADGRIVMELEDILDVSHGNDPRSTQPVLPQLIECITALGNATALDRLADEVAGWVRHLTGYDRIMVYKFDAEGHGKIMAESRHERLESLLGYHYPASDIPQQARELYLRNRVRVLVDVDAESSPIVSSSAVGGEPFDMSMCTLRSMSPLHLQYLRNMGVTATMVVSVVHDGALWGLIAAHHYSPRPIAPAVRAAVDLISEVLSTRISAIENYAQAQVALMVRKLEQRLVEATTSEGDWRHALLRNPKVLLDPLNATGAVLMCEGDMLTCGEVPSTTDLRRLQAALDLTRSDTPFATACIGDELPDVAALSPLACGVLAVRLSNEQPDFLVWLRKEQLMNLTWAGDPAKPMLGENPLELSPRRSFAAWSEIVRGRSLTWTRSEIALARSIRSALVDIIVQVQSVRLLIARHQIAQISRAIEHSPDAVAVVGAGGELIHLNQSLRNLTRGSLHGCETLADVLARVREPADLALRLTVAELSLRPWRGECVLQLRDGSGLRVEMHADVVPGPDGKVLGFLLTFHDRTALHEALAIRSRLEGALVASLQPEQVEAHSRSDARELLAAILTNANLAALDMADAPGFAANPALLNQIEDSVRRATRLQSRLAAWNDSHD
ncbi:MAG: GAF domain-containing protein [Burkholderiales bacterium]|nr:GAF domain-containing protein [Burkholderiales bacterium]